MWFLGNRVASIFWLKGVRPQRLPIFQQITATLSCYKRKWEEKGIQWKSAAADHDKFTRLVFFIYGSMIWECHKFYSRLSDLLSEKRNLPKSVVANWVRSKVFFALLKSSLLCLRVHEPYVGKHRSQNVMFIFLMNFPHVR